MATRGRTTAERQDSGGITKTHSPGRSDDIPHPLAAEKDEWGNDVLGRER